MKRIPKILILIVLLCSCHKTEQEKQQIKIFNTVWETVNTKYFDATFNGVDWGSEYDYYKPIIANCTSTDSLYYYLNQMLFKLNVSHIGAVPSNEPESIGSPQLFLDAYVGIDLRIINNEAIITKVDKNSTAFKAGIRPGFRILKVNGKLIESFIKEKIDNPLPPFNDINMRLLVTENIIREFYGEIGDTVVITYLDAHKSGYQKSLKLADRSLTKHTSVPWLPPMYAKFNKRVLNKETAYIHFDVFLPVILDSVIQGIQDYKRFSNLIIDLRGNPGGDFNTRRLIASQFVNKQTLFWKYQSRTSVNNVYLDPPKSPYKGRLFILIDELSSSSSEEFSGAMKAIGRATIIGQKTAGKVLTMEVVPLADGGFFIYPNQQTKTSKNEVLEAVGVTPDIEVSLDKNDLLKGIDTQLKRVLKLIDDKY